MCEQLLCRPQAVHQGIHDLRAPLALAALNGVVLAPMDWLRVSNMPSQMRRFYARPQEALSLLLGALQQEHGTLK